MFPIYIPSKGRAHTATTPDLLIASGLDHFIVVEPGEDEESYKARFGADQILILPKANRGLAYSRNFCAHHSRFEPYHWQLDDDIRSFMFRDPGSPSRTISAREALELVESIVSKYSNVGQAGLNQNSWPPGPSPTKTNNLPVQCVLNSNDVKAEYRDREPLEDMDFTLQVLSEGWCTIMFDHVRTNCPPIGRNGGGLAETYSDAVKVRRAMEELAASFPTLTVVEDDEGPHLRRNRIWSTFKQKLKER